MSIQNIRVTADKIRSNMEKVIIGKSNVIDLTLTTLFAGGHVLMEDIPGTGKTSLAKALAASIDGEFNRIQFTPDLLPADITGLNTYNRKTESFDFHKGPVFTNILLADEINRATPRTQSGLLECMQETQITIDGTTYPLSKPFFIIATQNPIETAGTYPLPEAQLDRFTMQISMGYPTMEEELEIMDRFIVDNPLDSLTSVCSLKEILDAQASVSEVFVHESVRRYIANLVKATREEASFMMGINPRGTLALLKCAQSYAAIQGRDYVIPDDVKALIIPVFLHRLQAFSTSQADTVADLLRDICKKVAVPTEDFTRA